MAKPVRKRSSRLAERASVHAAGIGTIKMAPFIIGSF
jgi:hypothetical protein